MARRKEGQKGRSFDFVLSFAGEDRNVAEEIRDCLKRVGLSVFYDLDYSHDLLGKDLAEHFSYLYEKAANYCIVLLSRAYLKKAWCRWERRSALARAVRTRKEYIIPYRLEPVTAPGVLHTIGFADMESTPPAAFADLLIRKSLGSRGCDLGEGVVMSPGEAPRAVWTELSTAVAATDKLGRKVARGFYKPEWLSECLELFALCQLTNTTDHVIDATVDVGHECGWHDEVVGVLGFGGPGKYFNDGVSDLMLLAGETGFFAIPLGRLIWRRKPANGKSVRRWTKRDIPQPLSARIPKGIGAKEVEELVRRDHWRLLSGISYEVASHNWPNRVRLVVAVPPLITWTQISIRRLPAAGRGFWPRPG